MHPDFSKLFDYTPRSLCFSCSLRHPCFPTPCTPILPASFQLFLWSIWEQRRRKQLAESFARSRAEGWAFILMLIIEIIIPVYLSSSQSSASLGVLQSPRNSFAHWSRKLKISQGIPSVSYSPERTALRLLNLDSLHGGEIDLRIATGFWTARAAAGSLHRCTSSCVDLFDK